MTPKMHLLEILVFPKPGSSGVGQLSPTQMEALFMEILQSGPQFIRLMHKRYFGYSQSQKCWKLSSMCPCSIMK